MLIRQNLRFLLARLQLSYFIFPRKRLDGLKRISRNVNSVSSCVTSLRYAFFARAIKSEIDKFDRYWAHQDLPELLAEADNLYDNGKYLEVYEILNRLKYHDNVEIQWRVCRALFKLSTSRNIPKKITSNMITEAYILITKALEKDSNHSQVHKWMAIILDAESGLDGIVARIRVAPVVKEHMLKSLELNPNDVSVLYMLGYWCYEMTKLSWLQRHVTRFLFYDPPKSSFKEAYEYFQKVENLQPRSLVSNLYMLGKCCYEMGMYYKARYYLSMASELPVSTEYHKIKVREARKLAEELKDYDLASGVLGLPIKDKHKNVHSATQKEQRLQDNSGQ